MKAILLEKNAEKVVKASLTELTLDQLPENDLLIDVYWSTLNYKDGLIITHRGKSNRVQHYPMVPGIDFSGIVSRSNDPRFQEGQAVLLTGWGVGETHWGGLSEKACVNGDWVTPLPEKLSLRQAMIIGTAGFTAMLCINALEDNGIKPESGEILVTGASGGVGSTAIQLLNILGYSVTAVSGRKENYAYLTQLGANHILSREALSSEVPSLDTQKWAGVIDTVGGQILATALAQTHYDGTVTACGLAGSYSLPTTVMPFILRNVRLQGIDSVHYPAEKRTAVWQRLASLLPSSFYQQATTELGLEQVIDYAQRIIDNTVTGRTLVKIHA